MQDTMQIFVSNLRGIRKTYDVPPQSKVGDLSTAIEENEGVPKILQRLTLNGKQLDENRALSLYEGRSNCTVHLSLRLQGGGLTDFRSISPGLVELAKKHNWYKKVCRKCNARLPPSADHCRKRGCGHSNELRFKKKLRDRKTS